MLSSRTSYRPTALTPVLWKIHLPLTPESRNLTCFAEDQVSLTTKQKNRGCIPLSFSFSHHVHTHSIGHFFFFFGIGGSNAATMALSNTSLRPFWVKALHSAYLIAFTFLAISLHMSWVIPFGNPLALSFSCTSATSRRSDWVPTSRHGTPGQWWCTSGIHFSLTFSNEAGDAIEKQTRKTSVWG